MPESKYGRLFTEADVLAILDEATMIVPDGFEDDSLDRILAMLIERAEADKAPMRFPADEPLFLLRGQDECAPDAIAEGGLCYEDECVGAGATEAHLAAVRQAAAAMREWQAANPDRVKVPD